MASVRLTLRAGKRNAARQMKRSPGSGLQRVLTRKWFEADEALTRKWFEAHAHQEVV